MKKLRAAGEPELRSMTKMVVLAAVNVLYTAGVVIIAFVFFALGCGGDGECSRSAQHQLPLALLALFLALCAAVSSVIQRGRPVVWLVASAALSTAWLLYVWIQ